jgi:8-oxo-dGTP pyrophosphatase MutT (NUDIX family)
MKAKNSSSRDFPPRNTMCVGAVVAKGDQILLVRQAKGHPLEGKWSIPWGFVDTGEFPDVAACRETLEESRIEAEHWMSRTVSSESGGRPRCFLLRDFRFHNQRYRSRCQRRSVSGWTMVSACFQDRNPLANMTSRTRSRGLQAGRTT